MDNNSKNELNKDLYRIGTFAKYMGVTPDFLKYYEQSGLIQSELSEKGYRYYRFQEATNLLECMILKNQGFTIREMSTILHDYEEDEIVHYSEEKMKSMSEELTFKQDIINDTCDFATCMKNMHGKESDWWITVSPAMYFLPHIKSRHFIKDDRIYELLPQWIKHMPLVHSASIFRTDTLQDIESKSWFSTCTWGLIVTEEMAKNHNIPVNDVVIKIPSSKSLFYHFKGVPANAVSEDTSYAKVGQKIQALSLNPDKYAINIKYMCTHIHSDDFKQNERFIIPFIDE